MKSANSSAALVLQRSRVVQIMHWLQRHPNITIGGMLVLIIVICAVFAPLITNADPYEQDLLATMLPPSWAHPFGTDDSGRDIFARVIYGARISLLEVALGVGLAVITGVPLGILSGMAGRRVDTVIMWCMDVMFAFPGIVLAILIISVLGTSLFNLLVAIAIFSVPVYARLARNLTFGLKNMDYVEAAVSLACLVSAL